MRYLAIAALLAAVSAFAQRPDPASGVLVPSAPPSFHKAIQNMVGANAARGTAPAPTAPRMTLQQPGHPIKACAIPLLRVPARAHLDDGLLRDADPSVDRGILQRPAAPPCDPR